MSELEHEAWEGEMEMILTRAQDLVGGSRPAVEDSWKWTLGDTIAQMKDLVKRARESVLLSEVQATPYAVEAARKIAEQYNAFFPDAHLHKHRRSVLVDYAAVAGEFPPGDPIRTELSHSHARALARVKAPEARAALAEQAIRSGWSVARLQGEINTAGRPAVEDTSTEDGPVGKWAKTQNSTWVCVQTGNDITRRKFMVELRIQPESTLDAKRNAKMERGKKPGEKRGAAAKKGRNGAPPDAPRVLRFESAAALLAWLGGRVKVSGPSPGVEAPEKPTSQIIMWPALKKALADKRPSQEPLAEKPPLGKSTDGHPAEEGQG